MEVILNNVQEPWARHYTPASYAQHFWTFWPPLIDSDEETHYLDTHYLQIDQIYASQKC